ncbi:hypothetical protein Nepgr_031853 [Nepenthes gracilis]|uniref:Uncharacterized protein n=1 Tax=Nepenthes gracilis TaxID=150966 RepID=A0AAD3TI96_NEPGR|nr:hypothetical protein Nepgr_031853 [Nepenthes gracilis]
MVKLLNEGDSISMGLEVKREKTVKLGNELGELHAKMDGPTTVVESERPKPVNEQTLAETSITISRNEDSGKDVAVAEPKPNGLSVSKPSEGGTGRKLRIKIKNRTRDKS